MSKDINEQLSALVDGELPSEEAGLLLRQIGRDRHARARVGRFQIISDTMSNHLPGVIDPGFASRVRSAIEKEPEISADAVAGNGWLQRMLRPLAGLAIAASVATVAIISVQNVNQQDETISVATGTSPGDTDYVRRAPDMPLVVQQSGSGKRLNDYLVNHKEYAANRGVQGMLPYVHVVGYENSKQ
jgi:sigma-E factor negative regulatory protein RseA